MNKEYICKRDKLTDLIEEIDNFETITKKYNIKHNNSLNYKVDIKEIIDDQPYWVALLTINKDETINN